MNADNYKDKFTIPHGEKWYRPDRAYCEYQRQAIDLDYETINFDGKYKRIRELRDISVFGIAFSALQGNECFVQMNDISDSPDAFLMRKVSEVTNEIAPVELMVYARSKIGLPSKTLLEKLSEKKGKFQKLPKGYYLLIHIGKGINIDHNQIFEKLNTINPNFYVFSVQEISNHPDTMAKLVSYYPELESYDINIGAICDKLSKSTQLGIAYTKKGKPPNSVISQ